GSTMMMARVVRFFFSSRRRHTRWPRDWSSDVCSSDLLPNRPYPAFRIGVQIRTSGRQGKGLHASCFDHLTKRRAVFAVVIMQQVLAMDQKTSIFHRHITRQLFHPLLIPMTWDSGQAYPPALQMNEKQHLVRNQPSSRKHFHREKVGRHQHRHVRTDKVLPTRRLLPLGSRWNIMATENIAHRLIREPVI